jgi:hypothetical protein
MDEKIKETNENKQFAGFFGGINNNINTFIFWFE